MVRLCEEEANWLIIILSQCWMDGWFALTDKFPTLPPVLYMQIQTVVD